MPSTERSLENYKSSNTPCLFLLPDSPKFTVIDANDAYLKVTGTQLSQIVGRNMFDIFPEAGGEDSQKRMKAFRSALENAFRLKKPSKVRLQRYDVKINKKSEPIVKFWNSDTTPILDANNKVLYLVHSIVEVTEFVTQQARSETDSPMFHENFAHPLFNDYPEAMATLDLYGNFLNVNKIFADLSAHPREELLNMSFLPLIAETNFQPVFEAFQKSIKGEIQNLDTEVINGAGKTLVLNMTFIPIIINNEVLGVYMITKDLTLLREIEEKSAVHQRQLVSMMESIKDGFFAMDKDWTVTYWNKEAERMLNTPRSEIIGKNLWEQFPESLNGKFIGMYRQVLATKESARFEDYLPYVDKWIEVSAYPNLDGLSIYFRDATARIKAKEELQEAKKRYEQLFDFSPFPIWVYDIDSLKFLAVNAAAIEAYGYSEAEFQAMNVRSMYPPSELPVLDKMLEEKVHPKLLNKAQVRLIKKSGEILVAELVSQPLTSWNDRARIIVAQDVTDRIKAEEALKLSEQRFKALVQDGSDLTAILDISGTFKYVSPSTRRVLGVDSAMLMHKNIFEFINPEDKAAVVEGFSSLHLSRSLRLAPFRVSINPAQYRWLESFITDLSDDEAVSGIVITGRDVTQRINNERKIKANIEHYNRNSRSSEAIYDWDLQTNELTWSKGFNEVFGYDCQDKDKPPVRWLDLIHPEDQEHIVDQIFVHLRDKKTRWKQQYRFLTSGGVYKAVVDRGFFVFNALGEPERMVGAIQDVTERLTYISNLEHENKYLKEISWMQSHVVRAPLARIMGLSELLTYSEGKLTNMELLAHLTDSAHELDQIISSILSETDKKIDPN
jgi:PAS domain S-box-containing protein